VLVLIDSVSRVTSHIATEECISAHFTIAEDV
jgi:hypothetical protein